MANSVTRKYEGMFLVDSARATANWDQTLEAVNNVLARAGAEVLSVKKWDDRRLCYEIKGHARGTDILTYFNCLTEKISGIERDVQISEDIMRVMILRADRIPEEMQAILTPLEAEEQRVADEANAQMDEESDPVKKEELSLDPAAAEAVEASPEADQAAEALE